MYQDNKISILLEFTGKSSSGNRIWVLNIRLVFMIDHFLRENVQIKYFPTDNMWGYFMTKSTQGSKFRYFRNDIIGGNE